MRTAKDSWDDHSRLQRSFPQFTGEVKVGWWRGEQLGDPSLLELVTRIPRHLRVSYLHIGGIQPPSNVLEEEKNKPRVPHRKKAIQTLRWFEKLLGEIAEGSEEDGLDSLYDRWDQVASYQWQEAPDWTLWPNQSFRRFQLAEIPDADELPALALLPKEYVVILPQNPPGSAVHRHVSCRAP